ncbi:glycosyltransferase family 39 protein [Patulibacter sp.]|uniref:ArnT family glycosyltransferase n=1 Tax=Patulibacter sp. TaxID=1912859 RepID=UPI002724AB66|nr:hypothetical protein [Patulibacter sp.]MDO9407253.1 hypothetical protein [Patulibacter sp.]
MSTPTAPPELPVPSRPVARLLPAGNEIAEANPKDDKRRPDDLAAPVRTKRFETLIVFFVAWLVFSLIGYRVVVGQHIVPADALNLMSRAFYVWHNDPAKLAAVGFTSPPLQTVGLLPFAIIKPLATGLVALPIASGFWGALALSLLHRTMARCGISFGMRLGMVVLIALNPMWLFYSTTGMPDMIYVACLAAMVYFAFTWAVEDQPRFVAGVGLTLALMAMSRFGFIWWAISLAVVFTIILAARDAHEDEREGLLITLLAPIAAAIVIWILACLLIASDPFGWVLDAQPFGGVSTDDRTQPVSFLKILGHTGALTLGVAPLSLLAIVAFLGRDKDPYRIGLGQLILIIGGLVVIVVNAVIHNDLSLLTLRSALPIMLLGIATAIWIGRTLGGFGQFIGLVAMVVAIPLAAIAMDRYPYQNLEQAFMRGILNQRDQEGTASRGGYDVGIRPEQRMAAFIKALAGERKDTVLADNSTSGGVILLTGRPQVFVDRVDRGDESFLNILENPWGKVRYILAVRGANDGSINSRYPNATSGRTAGMTVVYTSGRYVLLSVATLNPRESARRAQETARARSIQQARRATTTTTTTTP